MPSVTVHYARHGVLTEKILADLETLGHDRDALTLEDLKPLDQFHNRGQEATKVSSSGRRRHKAAPLIFHDCSASSGFSFYTIIAE
jgi:hypothetical protein